MISKTPTLGMTKEQWLLERSKTVGGSEIGAVLGLNPWQSAYSLWCERTGKTAPFEGNLRTEIGSYLEDFVAQEFSRRSGLMVKRTNYLYRNDRYPALHASPDRLIIGEDAGLECKTTSAFNTRMFKGSDFPTQYYAQAVQCMAVLEKAEWYIAVLVGNHAFHIYRLTRNQGEEKPDWCDASLYVEDGEIEALSGAAEAFLANVQNDTPPAVDGAEATTEAISERFPEGNGSTTDLFGREALVQSWFQIREARKGLEEQEKEIRNVLCADLGSSEVGLCGQHKVTWRTQTRSTFDAKACVADHPEMAAYYKTSTSRVFGIR